VAEDTDKIIYEIVIDDSKAREATDKLSGAIGGATEQNKKFGATVKDNSAAMDVFVPGLGGAISGLKGMVTSSLAFIATPIGAVVATLGLAVGALTKYFKGSEEGQDNLTKVVNIGKVAFELIGQVVENVGKVIFQTLEFLGGVAEKVIGFISDSAGASLKAVKEAAMAISILDDEIEANETRLIERRAAVDNKVQKLRANALDQQGAQKRATIQEAIKLEQDLAAEEVAHFQNKLKLFDAERTAAGDMTEAKEIGREEEKIALNEIVNGYFKRGLAGDFEEDRRVKAAIATLQSYREEETASNKLTEGQKKDRATLAAAIMAADTAAFSTTLRLKKEVEALDIEIEKAAAEREAAKFDKANAEQKRLIEDVEIKKVTLENAKASGELAIAIDQKATDDKINNSLKVVNAIFADAQKTDAIAKKQFLSEKASYSDRIILVQGFGSALQLLGSKVRELAIAGIIIEKFAAISQIWSATSAANAKAVLASPLTFGMPWVAINTGSAIASTALVITTAANSLSGFARSGVVSEGDGSPIQRANGDNRLVTAQVGEVFLNKRHQDMLGGAATFASIGVPGFASSGIVSSAPFETAAEGSRSAISRALLNSIQNIPRVAVVIEDVENLVAQRAQILERASL